MFSDVGSFVNVAVYAANLVVQHRHKMIFLLPFLYGRSHFSQKPKKIIKSTIIFKAKKM